jgi:predicted 3-demethylubiquinone-9 3-methyltransferase (glyoxalase superfamily)
MSDPSVVIAPCIWLDDAAEAAAELYTGVFPGSRVTATSRYPSTFDNPAGKPRGSLLTVEVELAGCPFSLLNGGQAFAIHPTISFFAFTGDVGETERMVAALADGGSFLMELGEYPWSPRYAWVQDRYGVSWQVMTAAAAERPEPRIVPCLMFSGAVAGRAEEALRHYASVFPDGAVESLERYEPGEGPPDMVKHGRARLGASSLVAMDSHLEHDAVFNEAMSLQVLCRDQAEVDHFWSGLGAGGEEGPCGWLKDRFGVSWQVVPTAFMEMMKPGEAAGPGYERAFRAMLDMKKLDLAALQAAFDQPA